MAQMHTRKHRPLSVEEYLIGGLEEVYNIKFVREASGRLVMKVKMMGMELEAIKKLP